MEGPCPRKVEMSTFHLPTEQKRPECKTRRISRRKISYWWIPISVPTSKRNPWHWFDICGHFFPDHLHFDWISDHLNIPLLCSYCCRVTETLAMGELIGNCVIFSQNDVLIREELITFTHIRILWFRCVTRVI